MNRRKMVLVLSIVAVVGLVVLLYAPATRFLSMVHSHSYQYSYFPSVGVVDTDEAPLIKKEATAVPILMYHGVRVKGELGTNTTRENFIAHMEMLKREGYETISVGEYDASRKGEFTLPSKPIIITFDDGRKDSFYTVDEVFRKLGFKATIFVATVKSNEKDPFFLSWDELRAAHKTGRWEIEAHGQRSHDEVIIDEQGSYGRYLTSRIYTNSGLESIADFEARVRADYEAGIADIKRELGVTPRYFAVPLNDYGNEQNSNYDDAASFNEKLTEEYFDLAFIEVFEDGHVAYETFYNYIDTDKQSQKRLEVKNMTADELATALTTFAPSTPFISFPATDAYKGSLERTQTLYGELLTSDTELTIGTLATGTAARVLLGDRGWQNYSVSASIVRGDTREASMVLYYLDEDNHIRIDWDDHNIVMIERVDGVDTHIVELDEHPYHDNGDDISASIHDGVLTLTFNGVQLVKQYTTKIPRGALGFGVWDPEGGAITVTALEVLSTVQSS